MTSPKALRYRDAGVDIDAGDALVRRIRPLAEKTKTPWTLGSVGGFAGLSSLPSGYREPVLVSGTDGVGTKLKIALATGRHDTVGIDLVAMCVNDILTVGAEPLFFLDYFATGALDVDQAEAVIRGIAEGCVLAGCALLGGETAELPGLVEAGTYDVAGFCVGVVERAAILDGARVQRGDSVLGIASRGLHSNGYSLARKALLERGGLTLNASFERCLSESGVPPASRPTANTSSTHAATTHSDETLADVLLTPTRIYRAGVHAALRSGPVHALCHVTGGGLVGNLPRVLPEGLGALLDRSAFDVPAIFRLIQRLGNVAPEEMDRTFNMGIGLVAICPKEACDTISHAFQSAGEETVLLGEVVDDATQAVRFLGE